MADATNKESEQQPDETSRREDTASETPLASGSTTSGTAATTMERFEDQDVASQHQIMDQVAHLLLQQQINPQFLSQQQQQLVQQQLLPQQQQPPHRQLEALTLQTRGVAVQESWMQPPAPAATCMSNVDDVEIPVTIEGAPPSLEDMEGIEQSPELYPMQPPDFIQNYGDSSAAAVSAASADQVVSMDHSSGEAIWEFIAGGPESYRSGSSGEERISLGTVLEVLRITQPQSDPQQQQQLQELYIRQQLQHQTQPSPAASPAQVVPDSPQVVPDSPYAELAISPGPDDSMVLNSLVMWAPPPEAQAFVRQQESLVNAPLPVPQPSASEPPPLHPVANADLPIPRAISALPKTDPLTVKSISGPVSAACITEASTVTSNSPCATVKSAMSGATDGTKASSSGAASGQIPQPQLPEYHELAVRGYYRNKEMLKAHVGTAHGCILYYNQAKKSAEEDLNDMTLVEYPKTPSDMTEKNADYTTRILDVIERGVRIRCIDGCIYATRRCRSKVFVCSSQDSKSHSKELKRDEETIVFKSHLFEKRYRRWLLRQTDDVKFPKPPNIVFTFAQRWSWESHHPLMNCLVYAVVTPMRARTQLEWGPNTNQKVESFNRGLSSSMLQVSQPSTEGSGSEPSK